ncbi:MAG TPA: MBL fold metallo-hydrolase [bacterium]|nr:MBL fold metallo-hydrolase [bacterium]
MRLHCWGSRGSVPVSGNSTQCYGGDTSCLELRSSRDYLIIIDAGTGLRELGIRLETAGSNVCHLLMTHYHWDHIMGFPFFKPLYSKDTVLHIIGPCLAGKTPISVFSSVMDNPLFPNQFERLRAEINGYVLPEEAFTIDTVLVETLPLRHPGGGAGYRFTENGKTLIFLTDNELGEGGSGGLDYTEFVHFCRDADCLIHDAEYTDEEYPAARSWGHSAAGQAVHLAAEAGVKHLSLFHHHPERTDAQIDRLVDTCRNQLEKLSADIKCSALAEGDRFVI